MKKAVVTDRGDERRSDRVGQPVFCHRLLSVPSGVCSQRVAYVQQILRGWSRRREIARWRYLVLRLSRWRVVCRRWSRTVRVCGFWFVPYRQYSSRGYPRQCEATRLWHNPQLSLMIGGSVR